MTYFKILLVIHVLGAIAGLGPTFAWAVAGPFAAKAEHPRGVGVLEMMTEVTKKMVTPVALVTQPLTGVLMIFEAGYNRVFFRTEWLWISIVLYIAMMIIAYIIDAPVLGRMIQKLNAGEAGDDEFAGLTKRTTRNGIIMTLLSVAIIILMVWKPGQPGG